MADNKRGHKGDQYEPGGVLTGNSGIVSEGSAIMHISAPYAIKKDYCFVWYRDKKRNDMWRRVKLETAKRKGWNPIPCSRCSEHAVMMDHYYPYFMDQTLCRKHAEEFVNRRKK